MKERLPLIFDIHRLAMEDGPGLRSTVFFKGCPLACDWCHNPESIKPKAEVAFFPDLCINCGGCVAVCPEGAIGSAGPAGAVGEVQVDRIKCTGCGRCADACSSMALRRVGVHYPVEDLMSQLLRDKIFYQVSGGGVTFSGGEPTQYLDYLDAILTKLRREKIPTAIQTCGHFVAAPFIERILPLVDLIYFDLKIYRPDEHIRFIGRDNRLILTTFSQLTEVSKGKIIPRIPLIPGRTSGRENLLALAEFLKKHGYSRCDLLPYNPCCLGKRRRIGMAVPQDLPESFLDKEEEEEFRDFFARSLRGQEVYSDLKSDHEQ